MWGGVGWGGGGNRLESGEVGGRGRERQTNGHIDTDRNTDREGNRETDSLD